MLSWLSGSRFIDENHVHIEGAIPSYMALALSQGSKTDAPKTRVIIADDSKKAALWEKDLHFFNPDASIYRFPSYDVLPLTPLSPHMDIVCDRMSCLLALQEKKKRPAFIVTTWNALWGHLPPIQGTQQTLLKAGDALDRDLFLQQLNSWGYQQVPLVEDRGQYAVRGFVLDIFPPDQKQPLRMEWIGDEVESLKFFDATSQKTIVAQEAITLPPVREISLQKSTVETFAKQLRAMAEDRDYPKSQWGEMLEKVKQGIFFPGLEHYLKLFFTKTSSFFDWLPPESVLIYDTERPVAYHYETREQEVASFVSEQKNLLTLADIWHTPDFIQKEVDRFPRVTFNSLYTTLPPEEATDTKTIIPIRLETHENLRGEIDRCRRSDQPLKPLIEKIQQSIEETGSHTLLTAANDAQAKRLKDLLQNHWAHPIDIVPHWHPHLRDKGIRTVPIVIGSLSQGFHDPKSHLSFITEEEIFGAKGHRSSKAGRSGGLTSSSLAELKEGDPLVHRDHGIGLYRGLLPMEMPTETGKIRQDFLVMEYLGGDKLYLPVYRMSLVQRYKGSQDGTPRLDKLGSTTWVKVKEKAQKAIQELAGELLNLYAARKVGKGFSFSPPDELFENFEATFPFEETPDQEKAIQDVLGDMQIDSPMDRLVLGDVGYGKTEVAIRAAFKAVLDKKQVALLVPTTLLAFQHFERFKQRFKEYAVSVDMVSRFRSPAEQKKILAQAAEGKLDILIGTHRLLQADISFKDLGLLVIDEEHRFGVHHKEKIKRLRKNVDVLSLSATPIPRTLYMSLIGLRGISVIETPPHDRLSIRTFVMPFDDQVVKESIERELRRGGQVFFIHNEVKSIGLIKQQLQQLLPQAKIEIAHGQMEEDNLEEVMIRFFHQEFDILICTTIVESGIDVPTANTMIINDADHFGLAQIYQLRGRVGRGAQRAFAYLLVDPDKQLTPEAKKRLEVLQRFSDLGAGYKIAHYDLEIRGAGNLLGDQQSGHMTALGYELYTEMLEKAVKNLKGEQYLLDIDPELFFRLPAYLSEDYLPDPPVRLEIYQRLAAIASEEEGDVLEAEMQDRFGPLPLEASYLVALSRVKCLARQLRIKQIRHDPKSIQFAFDPSTPLPPEVLTERLSRSPKLYRLTPDLKFFVQKEFVSIEAALLATTKFLRELILHLPSSVEMEVGNTKGKKR